MSRSGLIFLFALSVGLCQPAVPFLVYVARTSAFIEALCENKDRPELECHGFCHLSKQADEAQEEEAPAYLSVAAFVAAVLPTTPDLKRPPEVPNRWQVVDSRDLTLMLGSDVFRPPRGLSS
jgi:hypothetical protein